MRGRQAPAVLVSARDAGAARSILPVIQQGFARSRLSWTVVAQDPALGIFRDAGIPVSGFDAQACDVSDPDASRRLIEEATQTLSRIGPDTIVTGQSWPDVGVDEALLHVAAGRRSYTVQDVDGLICPGFGSLASHYFVRSEAAADLTRRRADVCPIVVGSLRHSGYGALKPVTLRAEGRRLIAAPGALIGFYGQPAWSFSGYRRTVEQLATALRDLRTAFTLVYRPHPRETDANRAAFHEIVAARGVRYVVDPNPSVEASLCAMDLVVVCYSSCGIDQVFLQRQAESPINTALFLMFEPDIRENYLKECGISAPLEVTQGLALGLTENLLSSTALRDAVESALTPDARSAAWGRIRQAVMPSDKAPVEVVAHIEHVLSV